MFVSRLPHQFDVVSKQVEAGLYSVKRTATTLRHVCGYQKGCVDVDSLLRTNQDKLEQSKKDMGSDVQMLYAFATNTFLQTTRSIITDAYCGFLEEVELKVAAPLRTYYDSSDKIRTAILKDATKQRHKLDHALEKVRKQRETAKAFHAKLLAKKKLLDLNGNPKKQAELEKHYDQLHKKADKMFVEYAITCRDANELQISWQSHGLPRALADFEALERGRFQMIEDNVKAYDDIFAAYCTKLAEIRATLNLIPSGLSQDDAIEGFCENLVSKFGKATPILPIEYDLPVSIEDLRKGLLLSDQHKKRRASIVGEVPTQTTPATAAALSVIEANYKNMRTAAQAERAADAEAAPPSGTARAPAPPDDATVAVGSYNFAGGDDTDLSFNAGEEIEVLEMEGEWWRGRIGDREGVFPANYVELKGKTVDAMVQCVCKFDYTPEEGEENYLTVRVGDVIQAAPSDEDWWWGTCGENSGFFPFSFCQVHEDPE